MAINKKKELDPKLSGGNPWLDNAEKGLSLIASLLKNPDGQMASVHGLDEMIAACGHFSTTELDKDFANIRQIIQLFNMPARNRLLRNTAIVGFGGGFSSGKSSVLNSLLGSEVKFKLPVSISPTTSISTYIMRGEEEKAMACSTKGREVSLDPDALEAISHQFREKHGISLAQYIEFVGLSLPQFPCPGVSLLDTPGYNKADTATQQQHHDRERSQRALSSVDHLVWIIDAKEPLLTGSDAAFIKTLDLTGKITVILNKCDKFGDIFNSTNPEEHDRILNVRHDLEEQQIAYTAVIPYSADEPDWNNGRWKIISALKEIAAGKKSGQERVRQLKEIIQKISDMFKEDLACFRKEELSRIEASFDATLNPLELGTLAQVRGLIGFERANLANDSSIFTRGSVKLQKWIDMQMGAASA